MVIERSKRTVHGVTAKELLHLHPAHLGRLQRDGFTLAQPISVQVSAKAARTLIFEIYNLAQNTTIGFCQDRSAIRFQNHSPEARWDDGRPVDLPIEHLCERVVARVRQLAEAIGARVTALRCLRSQGQDPCLQVALEPTR
jgi:hypothetical protein